MLMSSLVFIGSIIHGFIKGLRGFLLLAILMIFVLTTVLAEAGQWSFFMVFQYSAFAGVVLIGFIVYVYAKPVMHRKIDLILPTVVQSLEIENRD